MLDESQIDEKATYAKELASFSYDEIEKVERLCEAIERRFNAEAAKESHQKFRILFQRAAREWLPFIVYCLTFSPVAIISVWRIVELTEYWQIIGWIGLIFVMLIPVFSAPFLHRKRINEEKK